MSSKKQLSSGAEKAESLASEKQSTSKQSSSSSKKVSPAKSVKQAASKGGNTGAHGKTSAKKTTPTKQLSEKQQLKMEKAQEKKQHALEAKAERKQLRLDKKLEMKERRQERKAEAQERRAERREARAERRDMLRNETKAMRIERRREEKAAAKEERQAKRLHALEERQAKREQRLKLKQEKRAAKNDKRHAPGFGGWLAAVISLGVTTLALATIVTFGWINMSGMMDDMAGVQVQSLYELNSVVDNLDTNLAKARVTSSSTDQVRVFTDIAIESEMAEVILERMPVDITMTEEISSFINKMSDSAQDILYTVASGKSLSASQESSIEYMYQTNLSIKRALNELTSKANGKAMIAAMRGKGSILSESFTDIQNNAIESPKGIHDGPFADSLKETGEGSLKGLEEITAQKAEELAKEYFKDYNLKSVKCTGEAVAKNISLYNVSIKTKDGEMLAQLSKNGGKVVMFDSYKNCNKVNFSVERCQDIASDFLSGLGFDNLKAVWSSENGTTCNLNFAPVEDGTIIYPDLIKVKVCEERGIVTGMEAISYMLNNKERNLPAPAIDKEQAQSKISSNINVKFSRLALIPLNGSEVLTYEFFGDMGDNEYYVYVDASTGEEVEVLTIIGTAQGKALM
jgi:germination protein YpeB